MRIVEVELTIYVTSGSKVCLNFPSPILGKFELLYEENVAALVTTSQIIINCTRLNAITG